MKKSFPQAGYFAFPAEPQSPLLKSVSDRETGFSLGLNRKVCQIGFSINI
jgi:hypothetical protein